MISSLTWVPAGVADPEPKKYEMSAVEQELVELMQKEGTLDISEEPQSKVKLPQMPADHKLPDDLRMDEYSSDEDDNDVAVGGLLIGQSGEVPDDMMPDDEAEDDNEDRPEVDYDNSDSDDDLADVPDTREFEPTDVGALEAMGFGQVGDINDDEDDPSEAEDVRITEDDVLIIVGKTEDDFAALEVNVYDQGTGNLYVHHDIPLPAFPLCVEHGQVSSNGTTGNFCAVGTFSPGIEIWNLDVLNALEPSCVLGGEDTQIADDIMRMQVLSKSGKKSSKTKHATPGLRPGSHTDAVMALSWNSIHKQIIASGSADTTVKLWDVTQAGSGSGENANASTFRHHKDKVSALEWHPQEGTLLATGSYDRTVAILDARSNGEDFKAVKITADCEALAWDPFRPEYLTVTSDDGTIKCWDVRKFETKNPVWSIENEFGGVTDLAYNRNVPGLMVTSSIDKTVTLWDSHNEGRPFACGSKDMRVGKLYTVSFYPSQHWLLGTGGSEKTLALWDLSDEKAIQTRFGSRISSHIQNQTAVADEKELEAMTTPAPTEEPTKVIDEPSKKESKKGGKGKKKAHKRGR